MNVHSGFGRKDLLQVANNDRRKLLNKVLVFILIIFFANKVYCQNNFFIITGFGVASVLDTPKKGFASFELRKPFQFKSIALTLNCVVEGSDEDGYVGLGASLERRLSKKLRIALTSGFGRFSNKNMDLGSKTEFRSGIDLFLKVARKLNFVFSFYHYSNAGISEYNPGSETITVRVSVPLGREKW